MGSEKRDFGDKQAVSVSLENLVEDVKDSNLSEGEAHAVLNTGELVHARRHLNSEPRSKVEAIESLEAYAEARPELANSREVLNRNYPRIEDIEKQKVSTDFYNRTLEETEGEFLVDDCIWYDLFKASRRSLDPLEVNYEVAGFIAENYDDPTLEASSATKKQYKHEDFDHTDITGLLKDAESVYYAEGLRERLVEDEAHNTEAAGIFMDTVEELANEVSDEPVNGSQYPVDAGIAEAASQNDLDIVTYDQDFLDENDPITMPEVEVYTPHQATEMMV